MKNTFLEEKNYVGGDFFCVRVGKAENRVRIQRDTGECVYSAWLKKYNKMQKKAHSPSP
jgi:hypothetical protein